MLTIDINTLIILSVFLISSGKSPFLDDSDEETKTNILRCDFSFPNEYFLNVSHQAKDLIQQCLSTNQKSRATTRACLESKWFQEIIQQEGMLRYKSGFSSSDQKKSYVISSMHLCDLVRRRMKKLNSVAPLLLAPSPSRIPRPESL